jgi:shikimate kinase
MRAARSLRAVFLVGFMGSGKTSVGRTLAERLNWSFEDLDDRIAERERRSIAEIFRESGEAAFRQAEHSALLHVLEEVQGGTARIVALGGGAFAQKRNQVLLETAGVPTIFLSAGVEELWRRCCQQAADTGTERPLLENMGQFQKLYRSRHKAYSRAFLKIETGGRGVHEIAAEIAQIMGLRKLSIRIEQGDVE